MPSDRRCVLVRFSDEILLELDRLSVDFGVSRSAIVAALVESNSDELPKLASLMGGLKGGRRVSSYAPKRCADSGFQSCMCSTTATNSHKYHETLTP